MVCYNPFLLNLLTGNNSNGDSKEFDAARINAKRKVPVCKKLQSTGRSKLILA
jgi:hypothetical protein